MIIAGSDVWGGDAIAELRAAAEALRVPVFTNGMGRGALPPAHPLAFAKARRPALDSADVVAVIGTPLDFRLGFGDFGGAQVVHIVDAPSQRASHVSPAVSPAGDLRRILAALAEYAGDRTDHAEWIAGLRSAEDAEPAQPGTWLDPGPYGCLGTGMGYAMGARVTHPDRQVCVLFGDGAAGFSLMDAESLVRQRLPVVMVVGNNGIWGLEKHPMNAMYGYDVAADLQPGLRYDEVVRALGGAGELVEKASEIGPALVRAFEAGVPYLVNVLTDPADVYPRSANLA